MKLFALLAIVLIGTAAAQSVTPQDSCEQSYMLTGASPSTQLSIDAINAILREHNDARRNVTPAALVMPMLQWDQDLANFAKTYMDTCPHGNSLKHSSNTQRRNLGQFSNAGENLAAGSSSSYQNLLTGGVLSTAAWNDEVKDWTYNRLGSDCNTGAVCGHYTQNIWAKTTHVGCAYARCDSLRYKNYWSCVYGPAGNYRNQYPYERANATHTATCQRGQSGAPSSSASTVSVVVALVAVVASMMI